MVFPPQHRHPRAQIFSLKQDGAHAPKRGGISLVDE
uniref:Uncharacterized protein n=1 Tax=Anguilla anguilla TaxID=7936 RepID=A0A0E9TBB3_ANGAN